MNTRARIKAYLDAEPEPKRSDLRELHRRILKCMPKCKLWFLDGKDDKGRTVSNPNIGYGLQTLRYADGKERDFYQIGMSANTVGISLYILGVKDRKILSSKYGRKLGLASVTGYCIKFKKLADIDVAVLESAIRYGVEQTTVEQAR